MRGGGIRTGPCGCCFQQLDRPTVSIGYAVCDECELPPDDFEALAAAFTLSSNYFITGAKVGALPSEALGDANFFAFLYTNSGGVAGSAIGELGSTTPRYVSGGCLTVLGLSGPNVLHGMLSPTATVTVIQPLSQPAVPPMYSSKSTERA